MVARMRGVKRKLEACADEEAKIYRQVDARTAHLAELASMHTLDDVAYEPWSRRRLDRLLVDYLLRHGYGASASALVGNDAAGVLRDLVDVDTFAHLAQIRQRLLRDHSVTEALAWCADNKKELRKMESRLEFMLRFQQFIEMVRTQDLVRLAEAITHARRYLTPLHTVYPEECQQAAVLMCYPAGEAPEEYSELWNDERWAMLADLFTSTHNQLLSLPSVPLLHLALSSGLSALKTPACHSSSAAGATVPPSLPLPLQAVAGAGAGAGAAGAAASSSSAAAATTNGNNGAGLVSNGGRSHDDGSTAAAATTAASAGKEEPALFSTAGLSGRQMGASVCPICSLELNELARHVPYAHHSKSHVEHDLMLLPNGRVYGKARLDAHARKAELGPGLVRDLRTGDVYPIEKLQKVYIT